jgi:hypothetical protein
MLKSLQFAPLGVATNAAFPEYPARSRSAFVRATVKGLRYFKSNREGRVYDAKVPSFVSDRKISEDFQDRGIEFKLKTIGMDKKISRERVFVFSTLELQINSGGRRRET